MKVRGIKGKLLIDPEMQITSTGLKSVPDNQFVFECLKGMGDFKYIIQGNGFAKNGIWEFDFELTNLESKTTGEK